MTTVGAAQASAAGAGSARLGGVRIAWADAATHADPEVLARLGAGQARRHASMQGVRAARFLAGRSLLAALITQTCGSEDFVLSSVCAQCGAADHGAPRVLGADVAVSVSYANGLAAVAVAESSAAEALGIDIESVAGHEASAPLVELAPLFAPAEPPDLRGWTLIEAALKADGRGLRVPPDAVRLGAPGTHLPGARRVIIDGRDQGIEAAAAPAPAGYLLSVAMRAAAPRV